jgi:signal peptidase I
VLTLLGAMAAPTLAALLLLLLLRSRLLLITVEHNSMFPTLRNGDRVLAVRRGPRTRLRRGQILIVAPPAGDGAAGLFVKRALALGGDPVPAHLRAQAAAGNRAGRRRPALPEIVPQRHVFVVGDHQSASSDSRDWGPLPETCVVGVVVVRLSRDGSGPRSFRALPDCPLIGLPHPPLRGLTPSGETVDLARRRGSPVLLVIPAPGRPPEPGALAPVRDLARQARGQLLLAVPRPEREHDEPGGRGPAVAAETTVVTDAAEWRAAAPDGSTLVYAIDPDGLVDLAMAVEAR